MPEAPNKPTPRSLERWRHWVLIPVFAFLALVLAIIALSIQGSGYVLLVGSLVCLGQALELHKEMRGGPAR